MAFTIEQIREAHSKVISGADFPLYIREIKSLGVESYETFVADGNTIYTGSGQAPVPSGPKYATLTVADKSDSQQFQKDLKTHQQGGTDYPTFCNDCAKSGVEKWKVDLVKMTCTYFDKEGMELLQESIPG